MSPAMKHVQGRCVIIKYRNFPFIAPPLRSLTDRWARELVLLGRSLRHKFACRIWPRKKNIKYNLIITPL